MAKCFLSTPGYSSLSRSCQLLCESSELLLHCSNSTMHCIHIRLENVKNCNIVG